MRDLIRGRVLNENHNRIILRCGWRSSLFYGKGIKLIISRSLAPSSIATPPEMVAIPKAMPDIKRVNGNPLDCVTSMVRKIAATPASMKGILIMVRQMVFFIFHIYDNRLIVMYPRRPGWLDRARDSTEHAALLLVLAALASRAVQAVAAVTAAPLAPHRGTSFLYGCTIGTTHQEMSDLGSPSVQKGTIYIDLICQYICAKINTILHGIWLFHSFLL